MTDIDDYEPADSGKSVSFWDKDGRIYKILRDVAFSMNVKPSELVREMVVANIDSYAEWENLDKVKRKWIKHKQQEIEESYAKDLARAKKKRSTFINFICSQIYDMRLQGASEEEIKGWLEENKTLFENRNDLQRYEHIKNNVKDYYSAYNRWTQENKVNSSPVAFEPPKIEEGESNDE